MRALGLLTAALLALTGCAAFSSRPPTGDGLRIAAGFYPLAFVAERVAGPDAVVDNLTSPGKEPHDLEPTIRETAEVAEADLVVHESGLAPALDDAIDQNASGRVLDVTPLVHLQAAANGDPDPHFWQDPRRLAVAATAVADALSRIDPRHAAGYHQRAAALDSDLTILDAAYQHGLADCVRNTVVVSHDAFGYLGRYGLSFAPIAGLSPDAEPTPADLGRLQQLVRDDGITTVFGERLASPRLTETLAHDLGVRTAVLDPIEGLTDQTAHETYLTLMRTNLTALEQANGCQEQA